MKIENLLVTNPVSKSENVMVGQGEEGVFLNLFSEAMKMGLAQLDVGEVKGNALELELVQEMPEMETKLELEEELELEEDLPLIYSLGVSLNFPLFEKSQLDIKETEVGVEESVINQPGGSMLKEDFIQVYKPISRDEPMVFKNSLMEKPNQEDNLITMDNPIIMDNPSIMDKLENVSIEENLPIEDDFTVVKKPYKVKDENRNFNEELINRDLQPIDNTINKIEIKPLDPVISKDNIQRVNNSIIELAQITTEGKTNTMEVKLYPEELGPVNISLTMEDGKLTAKILVDNDQVKELFTSQINELNNNLIKQNIHMEKVQIDLNANLNQDSSGGSNPRKGNSFKRNGVINFEEELMDVVSSIETKMGLGEVSVLA